MREKWGKKVWEKCEKQKRGKNVKNSGGKKLEKNVEKIGVEKNVNKNDLKR
jgi:hypothetical protein